MSSSKPLTSTINRSASATKGTSTSNNNNNNSTSSSLPSNAAAPSTSGDNASSTATADDRFLRLVNQPSYCGHRLKLTVETLSPVCSRYTLEPQSPEYSVCYGFLTLVDLIIIVFAIGTKLPSLLQISTPGTTITTTTTTTKPAAPLEGPDENIAGAGLADVAALVRANLLLAALLVLLLARVLYRVVIARVPAERLTVMRGVGIQMSRQTVFGGWGSAELVDAATITSFVVHEAYLRHRVVFFLALACQDRPNLVLPFANTLPQLQVLRIILRSASGILFAKYQQQQQGSHHNNNNNKSINNNNNVSSDDLAKGGSTNSNENVNGGGKNQIESQEKLAPSSSQASNTQNSGDNHNVNIKNNSRKGLTLAEMESFERVYTKNPLNSVRAAV